MYYVCCDDPGGSIPARHDRDDARRLARDWHELTRSISDLIPSRRPVAARVEEESKDQTATVKYHKKDATEPDPTYAAKLSALYAVLRPSRSIERHLRLLLMRFRPRPAVRAQMDIDYIPAAAGIGACARCESSYTSEA